MEDLEKDIEYIILKVMADKIVELNTFIKKDIIFSVRFRDISEYPKYEDRYMSINTFLSIVKMELFKEKGIKIVSYPYKKGIFCCKIKDKNNTWIRQLDNNEDRAVIKSIASYLKYIR